MDIYLSAIFNCLSEIENVYFRQLAINTGEDIASIMNALSAGKCALSTDQIMKMNDKIGEHVITLSYLIFRMKFYGIKKLDFSQIPELDSIVQILLPFTQNESVNAVNLKKVNRVVQILADLDKNNVSARTGLGYKALRLCLVLLLFGAYASASILITLILEQISLS